MSSFGVTRCTPSLGGLILTTAAWPQQMTLARLSQYILAKNCDLQNRQGKLLASRNKARRHLRKIAPANLDDGQYRKPQVPLKLHLHQNLQLNPRQSLNAPADPRPKRTHRDRLHPLRRAVKPGTGPCHSVPAFFLAAIIKASTMRSRQDRGSVALAAVRWFMRAMVLPGLSAL